MILAVDFHFAKPVVGFDGQRFYKEEPGIQGLLRLIKEVEPITLVIEEHIPLRLKVELSKHVELYTLCGWNVAKERRKRKAKKSDESDAAIMYELHKLGKTKPFKSPRPEILELRLKVEEYNKLTRQVAKLRILAENGDELIIRALRESKDKLKQVEDWLKERYGNVSKAIIASHEPANYTLRRWLIKCGFLGNKNYNRALRHAFMALARAHIIHKTQPYYSYFKAYIEQKKQRCSGVAAYKKAWIKLAKKIAIQIWREAKGCHVDLSKLYGGEGTPAGASPSGAPP